MLAGCQSLPPPSSCVPKARGCSYTFFSLRLYESTFCFLPFLNSPVAPSESFSSENSSEASHQVQPLTQYC